jgi:hypothetical protein
MNRASNRILASLGLALGFAAAFAARADLSASAGYVLLRGSFTTGIPDLAAPPASANYRLAEGNLGDVSASAIFSAAYLQHPGYLTPTSSIYNRPSLLSVAVQGGRIWLEWTSIPGATYYVVESAVGTNKYVPVESVSGVTRWDGEVPVLTSRFYRIKSML